MSSKRDTYLSIDLDYWRWDDADSKQVRRFFRRVWALGLKVTVAIHHHHLLSSINRASRHLQQVINIDYHSDIAEEDNKLDLNEGTWANFVDHRERMTFDWRYPEEGCLDCSTGYCHAFNNPFKVDCTRWGSVVKHNGLVRIPWQRIRAVGVCISPTWLNGNLKVVQYPFECLRLFDLYGKWTFYEPLYTDAESIGKDIEEGVGIFAPYRVTPVY